MRITGRTTYLAGRLAHLLSFHRRRRKIETPQWQSVASYAELLGARRPSILWLREPEQLPPNTELLFPELVNAEILDHHSHRRPRSTGIGLACLRNAVVSGPSLVGTSSVLYLLPPVTPLFVDQYLSSDGPVGDRGLSGKAKRFVRGTTVLLTHWNSTTYGHWLLEGMPKLLLLRTIRDQLPPLHIVLPLSIPEWVASWIGLILPQATIERYDDSSEYLQCDMLLMPTLLTSPEHFPHPELASLLDDLLRLVPAQAGGRKRLYVSRVAPSLFRELSNRAEIEQIAVDEGLTLVKPETLSIADQIALFAQAELVVGEFGSAMHNTLFSPPGTTVFCLNWINALQSYLGQLKRQRVGYLLPSSGVPVTYVMGAPRLTYSIDPQVFRRCLRALG